MTCYLGIVIEILAILMGIYTYMYLHMCRNSNHCPFGWFGWRRLMWPNILFHLKPQTFNRFQRYPKKYSQHLSKSWINKSNNSMNSIFLVVWSDLSLLPLQTQIHNPPSSLKTVPLMEVLCCRPAGATKACVTARPAPMAAILDTAPIGLKGTERVWRTFIYLKKSISLARRRTELRTFLFVGCLSQEMHGTKNPLTTSTRELCFYSSGSHGTTGSSILYCARKTRPPKNLT